MFSGTRGHCVEETNRALVVAVNANEKVRDALTLTIKRLLRKM